MMWTGPQKAAFIRSAWLAFLGGALMFLGTWQSLDVPPWDKSVVIPTAITIITALGGRGALEGLLDGQNDVQREADAKKSRRRRAAPHVEGAEVIGEEHARPPPTDYGRRI